MFRIINELGHCIASYNTEEWADIHASRNSKWRVEKYIPKKRRKIC